MDPIVVPAPPRSSYNPDRPVSDLIASQIKFFQHIERKRGDLAIDPKTAGNVQTEAGAAQYIAAVTRSLRARTPVAAAPPNLAIVSKKKPARKSAREVNLSLAAAAAPPTKSSASKTTKRASTKRSKTPGAGGTKAKP